MSRQKKRQVVLDTETTGLNPQEGHRVIEIGCVELINRRLTKNHFHAYINPMRVIDAGAIEVHGITNEFLTDKPVFKEIAEDFIAFIRDAELIIHNAPFDVGFLNHELALLSKKAGCIEDVSTIFDSLVYARKKHPGQRNSLDALCKRYGIDNSHRQLHGALLDAEILADVYLLMTGGQGSLLEADTDAIIKQGASVVRALAADRPVLKIIRCTETELLAHEQALLVIQKASGDCVWLRES
ncbi:MAG: DNA polymerase III subunit epsilon [Methylococcaceae bacterium]|nr:DNA polymerase III subunit epsilon [Methylococcaceae bacterium]